METKPTFQDRFIAFSADVLILSTKLPTTPGAKHIADQVLRSGTSVGAHIQEARSAESRADFLHKMQLALKELRETSYWLSLIAHANFIDPHVLSPLQQTSNDLTAILAKSVITAKKNAGLLSPQQK